MTDTKNAVPGTNQPQLEQIDLMLIFSRLLERKWFILGFTLLATLVGVAYALIATPVYRAQALVQIEQKEGGMPGMADMAGLFVTESEAVTEIELLRSRMVLGETVDRLRLDIIAEPVYFPVIGQAMARRFHGATNQLAETKVAGYAWGGEQISVATIQVPTSLEGEELQLTALGNNKYQLSYDDSPLLTGTVGELASGNGIELQVNSLQAHPGTAFSLTLKNRLQTIIELTEDVAVSEKGKKSGILTISLDGDNPARVQQILNTVIQVYVMKNVDRNSAEASKSLAFLQEQLPQIRLQLEEAEKRFNSYQVSAESVDISAETQALLEQLVAIEEQISTLQLQEVEVKRRYRPDHPTYMSLVEQMGELTTRKNEFQKQIKNLPGTQQELLRLRRDVEVNTQIYTQMLNNIQELDIARAGTIGNVRIIDAAEVNTFTPVKPQKAMAVVVATAAGGFISVLLVLLLAALRRGVENPADIENMGLPVYAAIPFSGQQEQIEQRFGRKFRNSRQNGSNLLAITNPTDVSVEALRSLRTSIHFAMIEAKNNIFMITGPSPSVGKSFVSANLAATMAQTGKRIVLVDADMRKGYVHKMFNLEKKDGLADYLGGTVDYQHLLKTTEVEGLTVINHGTVPPNPSELLMSERFEELMQQLSSDFDLVIVDTPPVMAVTDSSIVGRYAGTTMLVTRYQLNPLKEIEVTVKRLEQNGVETKGVIFNAIKRNAAGYNYGYGYGYGYYTYDYGQKKSKK